MKGILLPIVLGLVGVVYSEDFTLTILHNNDMHSRFEETSRNSGTCKERTTALNANQKGCVGGFARTAHIVRKFRNSAENGQGNPVLYLNAGDTFVGTAWFSVHKWKIAVDFMNILKPDVACLGNHEFDFGASVLAPYLRDATFPIIAANVNFTGEPTITAAIVKKSVTLEVNHRKIGVIGHVTPDTRRLSAPGAITFTDVLKTVREESEALNAAGVDIIIVLGHSGYGMDLEIAKQLPLVDIVIGGHTNTFLWNGSPPDQETPEDLYPKVVTQTSGKKVPVVQAYAYSKYMGVLNTTFNEKGDLVAFNGQPILMDTFIPQETDVLELLEKYRPEILALDEEVVGTSRVLLDTTGDKCRRVECNIGNMLADAFVHYMASQNAGNGWTQVPIGLLNGGTIRTTIDPTVHGGNITRGELLGTLPFDNQVYSMTLTGKDLVRTLEIGVRSNGETSRGEFLQVSGLHVVYDLTQPAYSRVVSVSVRCGDCQVPIYEPVNLDAEYNLVTVSFLVGGGDDHVVLEAATNKQVQDLGDVDMIAWYLKRHSPIYPEISGRIEFVDDIIVPPVDVSTDPPPSSSPGQNSLSLLLVFVILSHCFR